MPEKPEDKTRNNIHQLLIAAGWVIQDTNEANVAACRGVAIREFPLNSGHGFAGYLLYVDGAPAGVIEAKKEGETLTGYEIQTEKYSVGLQVCLHTTERRDPRL
jgi:type I restriction enzyme R subunit